MNYEEGIFRAWLVTAMLIVGFTIVQAGESHFSTRYHSIYMSIDKPLDKAKPFGIWGNIYSCQDKTQQTVLIEKWKEKGTNAAIYHCQGSWSIPLADYSDYGRDLWEGSNILDPILNSNREKRNDTTVQHLISGLAVLVAWVLLFLSLRFIFRGFKPKS